MYIIPAIDIIDGKCVRLTQGDYEQNKGKPQVLSKVRVAYL
ncbi:MAG: HisA/HisF-related TIM barrel protein, partial [Bacteroidota bacterium]